MIVTHIRRANLITKVVIDLIIKFREYWDADSR